MSICKYQLDTTEPAPSCGTLLSITSSLYEGDWKSIRHSHHFTELFYVKSGNGEFIVEEQSFPICKGDLIIVNSAVEHTETSSKDAPLEYIALGVEDLQFSFPDSCGYFYIRGKDTPRNMGAYFSAISDEAERQLPGFEAVCQNFMGILSTQLIRFTNARLEAAPQRNTSRECSRIRRYIDSNYQDDISLDMLAELAHLNKYYFVHAFTGFYGQSPMNYLTQRRIKVSQDLLTSSDYSISEIAQLSGFSSPSYFSQCFRKYCGITAQTYRRQHAQKPNTP